MTLLINQKTLEANPELLTHFLDIVQSDAKFLIGSYPNFLQWLETKVLPELSQGKRTVVLEERDGKSAGLLILKHTAEERKLCTLRIRPEFENRGLGVKLFDKAFEILDTNRPLLSVSDQNLPKFSKIFDYFGFICEASYRDLYVPKSQELAFNGVLKNASLQIPQRNVTPVRSTFFVKKLNLIES